MGFKIKKISPKQFANTIKKSAQAAGQSVVKSANGVAAAGKNLGKCKVGDVKCAAKGMANLALSGRNLLLAASPMGLAYVAADKASGGKIGKGVSAATKATLGIDMKDLASTDINKFAKAYGEALYNVSGAKQAVTAGKALAKCKPKDAACIAKNLGQIAAVAANYVPGAGGAAAVAAKVAKAAVKAAIQKEIEAIARKKLAKEKEKRANARLNGARNDEERQAALSEVESAKGDVNLADTQLNKVENEKVAAEKQLGDSALVVAQQNVAKQAYDQQKDVSNKYPEIAAQVNAQVHPDDAAAQADAAAAVSSRGTSAVLESQNEIAKGIEKLSEEPKYYGIPQSKLVMGLIGLFFFLITIILLKN